MIDQNKLQSIVEKFSRDIQGGNLPSQNLIEDGISERIQQYLEEDLMQALHQIASEPGESSEVDPFLQTYPGKPEKTIVHKTHPTDRLLLEAYRNFSEPIEDVDEKGIVEKSSLNRSYIAFLVDFCLHTQFHIVLVENNLMENSRFNNYQKFVNRSNDRVFVNEMRIRAINHLLLIALTNSFAKEALISVIQSLSEPHQAITLSTKEYFKLVKSLKASIDLHKEFLELKINSPLFIYESSIPHNNLNEIEVTINLALQEL